jgi:membrane fusion protein, multidrug efflux system
MNLINQISYSVIILLVLESCTTNNDKSKEEKFYIPLVEIASAERKPFTHQITAQGNVESGQDILLSAEVGGLINKIKVKSGDRVSAGQVLVVLDGAIVNSGIKEIEVQLDYAEYMLLKQEQLKNKGLGSEFDYRTALNGVNSLYSRLNTLKVQREKLSIKAPFAGIIDVVFAKQGQLAGPQAPLLRLINVSNVEITSSISEKHLSRVKIGTPIQVTFPNFNDSVLDLKVNTVGNYIEPTNRTFRFTAIVSGNSDLLPNMLVEVSITDLSVEDGLVIPSKSILKSQDNTDYVWVASPSKSGKFKVKKVVVTSIQSQGSYTLIEENIEIKKGAKVIVEGARGITEKDQVRIK